VYSGFRHFATTIRDKVSLRSMGQKSDPQVGPYHLSLRLRERILLIVIAQSRVADALQLPPDINPPPS
jgi:hypothetical protein